MLIVLSGETGGIPVRVRRREALLHSVLTEDAAIFGTEPLDFTEKAEWFCAKSEYPGSKTHTKTARHGFVGNTI